MVEANAADIAKALNDLARHQMVHRLYLDILVDLTVCEIEGWDKTEYIQELRNLLNGLGGQIESKG